MANDEHSYDNRTERLTLTDRELKDLMKDYIDTGAIISIAAVFEAVLMLWCLDLMNGY
jgi:hypothetical protein